MSRRLVDVVSSTQLEQTVSTLGTVVSGEGKTSGALETISTRSSSVETAPFCSSVRFVPLSFQAGWF